MKKKIVSIIVVILIIGIIIGLLLYFCKPKDESDNSVNKESIVEQQVTGVQGAFVIYKDYIYYWKLNESSRETIALFANYSDKVNVKNELIRADQNGKEEVLIEEKGSGDIFIVNDRIFLSYEVNMENGKHKTIYSIDLDGKNKKEFTSGEMKYIVGDYIFCQGGSDVGIFAINTKKNEMTPLKKNAEIIACEDNVIYYTNIYDYKTETLKIGSITELKDNGMIATFVTSEFESYPKSSTSPIEVIKLWKNNDIVNINVGYREGTANMLQELFLIQIDEKKKTIEKTKVSESEMLLIENEKDVNGVYSQIKEENGKYTNVYLYMNEETKKKMEFVSEEEILKKYGLKKDDEHMLTFYTGSVTEDDIYMIFDYSEHYPSEDIGWRYAYKNKQTICVKYNLKTKKLTDVYEINY